MRKILFALVCLTLASCHEGLKDRAAREAKEFTRKNCPQQLSNGLQCDSMVFEPGDSTLHYFYSLSGLTDNKATIAAYRTQLRTGLLQGIRNDVTMRTYKEAGFNYAVTIHSASNPKETLYEDRFSRKEYQ